MKRIDNTIHIMAKLREESHPPISRYTCLLIMARAGEPLRASEFKRLADGPAYHGILDSAVRQGYAKEIKRMGVKHYAITSRGVSEIKKFLESPKMEGVAV